MTEVNLNPTVDGYRGSIGRLVFKKYKGRTIVSKKPVVTKEPSAEQLAQRERFSEATAYGKLVLSDPAMVAYYKPMAEQRDITVYALAVADFLKQPSVREIDLSKYTGQPGDVVTITAKDDVGVVSVRVKLSAADGTTLESGDALATGAGRWTYTATLSVDPGTQVLVDAEAFDRPGHRAILAASLILA